MICAKRGCTGTIPYIVLEMVPWLAVWLKAESFYFTLFSHFIKKWLFILEPSLRSQVSDVARLGEITGVCRHGGCSEGVGELLGSECFERIQTLTWGRGLFVLADTFLTAVILSFSSWLAPTPPLFSFFTSILPSLIPCLLKIAQTTYFLLYISQSFLLQTVSFQIHHGLFPARDFCPNNHRIIFILIAIIKATKAQWCFHFGRFSFMLNWNLTLFIKELISSEKLLSSHFIILKNPCLVKSEMCNLPVLAWRPVPLIYYRVSLMWTAVSY